MLPSTPQLLSSTSKIAAAGGGLTLYTYLGHVGFTTGFTSPTTFSSFNIGAASSNRVIAVAVFTNANPAQTITGVTIGGISATQATSAAETNALTSSDLWYASVPTGTTANIVITSTGSPNFLMGIAVAAIVTTTPTAGTGANAGGLTGGPINTNVTIPAGGVAFTILGNQNASTAAFSNLTIDDTFTFGGTFYAGHQTVTGTDTATLSGFDAWSMSTVPWGP